MQFTDRDGKIWSARQGARGGGGFRKPGEGVAVDQEAIVFTQEESNTQVHAREDWPLCNDDRTATTRCLARSSRAAAVMNSRTQLVIGTFVC